MEPGFGDYPAKRETTRQTVRLRFNDSRAERYAAAFRSAASQPIDFAGHFILATAGCGAGCVVAGAIDARAGRVTMQPFTVSAWPLSVAEPLDFRADSCLLVVHGSRDERGHGTYCYAFDGRRFALVAAREAAR